jgi:protein required for attachment to host cells
MRAWIVIADATTARVFALSHELDRLRLEHELSNPRGRAHGEALVADRPGSIHKGVATMHSAMGRHTAPHQVELTRFAQQIAEFLHEARARGDFDALAIYAPPQVLGLLRNALNPQARKCLRFSSRRDLTRVANAEMRPDVSDAIHACFRTPAPGGV